MPGRKSWLASLAILLLISGCGPLSPGRRSAGTGTGGDPNRQDPALSGDGRILASVIERNGRDTVILQDLPTGRPLPLRNLRGLQPHSSPSLSWNGRYLAVLVQQGPRRMAVIEDRATGRLHRLPLPGGVEPRRLSLAPDARRIALELIREGRSLVRIFDLSPLLEIDPPAAGPPSAPP